MKNFYTLFVVAFIGFIGNAQIINFPDANFKAKLLSASATNTVAQNLSGVYFKIDANNDGEIQISEAQQVSVLYVTGIGPSQCGITGDCITSLEGINSFDHIWKLNCDSNLLTNLDLTIPTLKELSCSNNLLTSINITGATNFTGLYCPNNNLTSLNESQLNHLIYLWAADNQITSLNIGGMNSLIRLSIENNLLTTLDFGTKSQIDNLNCDNNQLTTLNFINGFFAGILSYANNHISNLDHSRLFHDIVSLNCSGNQITSLDVTSLTNLRTLSCNNNQLTSLNIAPLHLLEGLSCSDNLLANLTINGFPNLNTLQCGSNPFTSFNLNSLSSPLTLKTLAVNNLGYSTLNLSAFPNLTSLNFSNNPLTIPAINGFATLTKLTYLNCSGSQISTLDLSNMRSMQSLYCSNNSQLVSLYAKNGKNEYIDFSGNPSLQYICADEGQLSSVQSSITTNGYTNCHVNSYCTFTLGGLFYTINGANKFDSNTNGCDAADGFIPNLKVKFVNGASTANLISNTTGNYTYTVQTGTNVITPSLEMPSYFTISPTTYSIAFPTQTSPATANFCVTPNGVHNDLEVIVVPIGGARPGFDASYKIIYKNKGTGIQSGSINFTFNDAVLDFVSASPVTASQSTNNLNWNFLNLLPFETRTILIKLNLNSPTETPAVNNGDIFSYTASITGVIDEASNDNTSILNQTTVNSYDPNDKTCVEGTTVPPSMAGQYVHYIIRFENTGTANAVNVVVRDIIDTAKFDISTLVPLNGSHPFETKINSTNKAEFIFQNINLPFDDANNDGYVIFKIKTKPTLVVGNTFKNGASIHFDYNFPITTNNYTTTITQLGNPDFNFISLFTLSPVPAKNNLLITTKQDVIMSSASIYNMLGQLVQVTTNPSETIDVSGLKTGNYFIKIISDKGTASSKFIKE